MALAPGFADPVTEAQAVFRAVLAALSRPGLARDLPTPLRPPGPLTPELAAAALALADPDAPLWLDPVLADASDVAAYLRFHTGAAIVADPAEAAFALARDPGTLPPADAFALGTQDYPDRSATVVLAVETIIGREPQRVPTSLWGGPSRTPDVIRGEDRDGARGAEDAVVPTGTTPTRLGLRPSPPSPQGGGEALSPQGFTVAGPGVKGVASFSAAPLPPDFVERVEANHALFPRGVDWLLVGSGRVVGLPRSAVLSRMSPLPEAEAA